MITSFWTQTHSISTGLYQMTHIHKSTHHDALFLKQVDHCQPVFSTSWCASDGAGCDVASANQCSQDAAQSLTVGKLDYVVRYTAETVQGTDREKWQQRWVPAEWGVWRCPRHWQWAPSFSPRKSSRPLRLWCQASPSLGWTTGVILGKTEHINRKKVVTFGCFTFSSTAHYWFTDC